MRRLSLALLMLLTACVTGRGISPPEMKAFELSLATADERMAVAWHGGPSGHDAIYTQSIDASGRPLGSPHRVTDAQRAAYEPDLQLVGEDVVVAWYEKDATSGELSAWLASIDRNGQPIWRRQLDARAGYARNPVVRVSGDTIMVAWIETTKGETPAVWSARFDTDGDRQAEPRRVGDATADTWNLNAAVDKAGIFYVTYDARIGSRESELRLLAISIDNVRDMTVSEDDGFASVYPDIAINDSGVAALTWFDAKDGNEEIYLAVLPLNDLLGGAPMPAARITFTPTSSIGAYLAWNADRLALVWCDAVEGQQELYVQTFMAGKRLGPAQRLTRTATQSSIPSIRKYRKGFAVAWNEYQATGDGAHRAILTSEARVAILP